MLRFLLCDDDPAELKSLTAFLAARYGEENAAVASFSTARDALAYMEDGGEATAAILDVMMPGMSGAQLAARMRELKFHGAIIFLTSSTGFVSESYEVEALDYLVKPVEAARLNKALDKLEAWLRKVDVAGILLTSERVTRRVLFREICYAEAGDHVVRFFLTDGETLTVRGSLSAYAEELLQDARFARCHGSFIVNMDYIRSVSDKTALMQGGAEIPIARRYSQLKALYAKRVTGEKNL